MPKIEFIAQYPVLQKPSAFLDPDVKRHTVEVSQNGQVFDVSILDKETVVQVVASDYTVTDELLIWLRSEPEKRAPAAYPEGLKAELLGAALALEQAARLVADSVRYFLFRTGVLDGSVGRAKRWVWHDGASEPRDIPLPASLSIVVGRHFLLNEERAKALEEGLGSGFTPLAGMRHLFRAIQEEEPRFRCIDAVIALELCVKEALTRKCPALESLLTHVPSPPLDKLYGPILEQHFGAPSWLPKRKIQAMVTTRNHLVHRPQGTMISAEDAAQIVSDAVSAIYDLVIKLYPNWSISQLLSNVRFQHYSSDNPGEALSVPLGIANMSNGSRI